MRLASEATPPPGLHASREGNLMRPTERLVEVGADQRLITRLLLHCGAIGPLLFVVVFLVEGATRPDYDAWRTTISTLSWGDLGWIQIVSFVLFGLLMLSFAVGLRRALRTGLGALSGPILLFIAGLGLIIAGPFVTDPVLGYPPGFPNNPPPSLHGTIHNIASLIVFMAIPAACVVLGSRFARDRASRVLALYSITTGIAVLVFVVWFFAAVVAATHGGISPGGLPPGFLERVFSIIGCCWLSLLALRLLHKDA
jgi:hypothetical membrane protein